MPDFDRFRAEHPGVFVLAADDLPALQRYLADRGWLGADESIESAAKAGEGNMNYTLRVRTDRRTLIVKQARPWVEKYDFIAAPWDRARVEAAFYREVGREPALAARLPRLLGADEDSRVLALEDLGAGGDLTGVYAGETLAESDLAALGDFLAALHAFRPTESTVPTLRNEAMRALNHAHIFDIPLQAANGLDLDTLTPGLAEVGSRLKTDAAYVARVAELGRRYLAVNDAGALLHGDFFFGSFLRTAAGLRVIDPEFCFLGEPEFDWAVLSAHLQLAGQPDALVADLERRARAARPDFDGALFSAYAGTEIMRRLLGYAQLAPLQLDLAAKERLLERSRALVLG
ncbi:MAG: phosphotransferase [Verrucomicrobia bacterium]|nr:phosphotransferase [Verrucomicrobiota bacterium]